MHNKLEEELMQQQIKKKGLNIYINKLSFIFIIIIILEKAKR